MTKKEKEIFDKNDLEWEENYDLNAYCLSCFPTFEIDLTKYIEKEK